MATKDSMALCGQPGHPPASGLDKVPQHQLGKAHARACPLQSQHEGLIAPHKDLVVQTLTLTQATGYTVCFPSEGLLFSFCVITLRSVPYMEPAALGIDSWTPR